MAYICDIDKCTGCGACVASCPKGCISLSPDQMGVLHWSIDEATCMDCGLCAKACPNVNRPSFHYPLSCHAAWTTDVNKRADCASGGIGTLIAEHVIEHKNGVFFGTAYDETLIPRTMWTESKEGLSVFKGSKYVQGTTDRSSFKKLKDFLDEGRWVAYVATPCQVAGLRSFLSRDYDRLVTIDLICHGVCPYSYFGEWISEEMRHHGLEVIDNVRFRGNDGNNYRTTLWSKGNRIDLGDYNTDFYLAGFLNGVTLRDNCFSCEYARPDRVADLKIGDFLGLGKDTPFAYKVGNVSSVTLNTAKGESFYCGMLAEKTDLQSHARDYAERLKYRPSLLEPAARHPLNKRFKACYVKLGFVRAIKRTMWFFLWRKRLSVKLKRRWVSFYKRLGKWRRQVRVLFLIGEDKK